MAFTTSGATTRFAYLISSGAIEARRAAKAKAHAPSPAPAASPAKAAPASRPAAKVATRRSEPAANPFAHLRAAASAFTPDASPFAHLLPNAAQREERATEDAAAARKAAHTATVRSLVAHVYAAGGKTPPTDLAPGPVQPRLVKISAAEIIETSRRAEKGFMPPAATGRAADIIAAGRKAGVL